MIEKRRRFNKRYFLTTRLYGSMAAGLALLGLLITFFVMIPQYQSTLQLLSDKNTAEEQVFVLEVKVAQLIALPESTLLANENVINAVLPSHKPLLELLNSFNQVALQTNVNFSDVSLSPGRISTDSAQVAAKTKRGSSSRKKADFDQLELELSVTGTLGDVQRFLEEIELVAPVTTVTKMSLNEKRVITPVGEEPINIEMYEAKLITTTYFFTKSITATINAPVPELSADQNKVLDEIGSFNVPPASSQTEIRGGGLEDLFGVNGKLSFEEG